MPAHIVERVDGRLVAAHDDDGFVADLEQEVIALVADPVDVAGHEPFAADHPLHVRGEHLVVAVEPTIQAIADSGFAASGAMTLEFMPDSMQLGSLRSTSLSAQHLIRSFFGSYSGRSEAMAA